MENPLTVFLLMSGVLVPLVALAYYLRIFPYRPMVVLVLLPARMQIECLHRRDGRRAFSLLAKTFRQQLIVPKPDRLQLFRPHGPRTGRCRRVYCRVELPTG